jgi:uncharacterized protein YwqG
MTTASPTLPTQNPAWENLVQRLESVKRTAWRPVTETKTGTVLNSKFSGVPLLAATETWPCCTNCGKEMQLFLQLNTDDLPSEVQKVFGAGMLQVFYCTNSEQECEIECEAYAPFAKSTLLRIFDATDVVAAQPLLNSPVIDAFAEKVIVAWQAMEDYPHYEELAAQGITLSDDEEDMLYEHDYPKIGDKLLGWPAWVQVVEYPVCPDCGEKMGYLFQIDSEDNLNYMFGDMGCAHITQCVKHPRNLAIAWACC